MLPGALGIPAQMVQLMCWAQGCPPILEAALEMVQLLVVLLLPVRELSSLVCPGPSPDLRTFMQTLLSSEYSVGLHGDTLQAN